MPSFFTEVRRQAITSGVRDIAPSMLATGSWGLVTGIALVKVGLTSGQAVGMTLLVYAGSSQLAALPLLAAGLPLWTILLTALMVNSRFIVYSAGLQPHFSYLSRLRRIALGYFSGDIVYLIFQRRDFPVGSVPGKEAYYWTLAAGSWFAWQSTSLLGIVLAELIPDRWGLDLAGTLALIPIMIAAIVNRSILAAVCVACVIALVGAPLPYQLGLPLAVLAALLVGLASEEFIDRTTLRRARRNAATAPREGA